MKPRLFCDYDQCLFDTDCAIAEMMDGAKAAVGETKAKAALEALNASGFSPESFARELGLSEEVAEGYCESVRRRGRLYPGVSELFLALTDHYELVMVTYGNPSYQEVKLSSVGDFTNLFSDIHVVWKDKTKGEVVASYGEREGDVFLDDVPKHLLDVQARAPWVRCIRFVHPTSQTSAAHDGDGRLWPVVVSDTQQLNALLAQGR